MTFLFSTYSSYILNYNFERYQQNNKSGETQKRPNPKTKAFLHKPADEFLPHT